VNGANLVQDFRGICIGDVNGSYKPSAGSFGLPPVPSAVPKESPRIRLENEGVRKLGSGQYFEMPLNISENLRFGAVSLILNYPKSLVDVVDIKLKNGNELEDLYFTAKNGEIRIGWFENNGPISLKQNEACLVLYMKTSNSFSTGDVISMNVSNNSLCEFADESGEPIDNVILKSFSIEHSGTSGFETGSSDQNGLMIYPNPAKDIVKINYNIAYDGAVTISIFNLLGEKVFDAVNTVQLKGSYSSEMNLSTLPAGMYSVKMLVNGRSEIIKRISVGR